MNKDQEKSPKTYKKFIFPAVIVGIFVLFLGMLTAIGFAGYKAATILPDRIDSLLARFESDDADEQPQGQVLGESDRQSSRSTSSRDSSNGSQELGDFILPNISSDTVDPVYPDLNNDGIIQESEAPKPDDVDPEVERVVSELEALLSKSSLTEEEYKQVEELFNELQVLQLQEVQE